MPRADEILVVIDAGMTWRGSARTAFETRTGRYATGHLIGVLGQLHCFPGGGKVTLAWDNLPAPISRALRARIGAAPRAGGGAPLAPGRVPARR
jgi:hypothetical protein